MFLRGFFGYNEIMKVSKKINWVIKLPSRVKILVEVGDKVEVGQKLATFKNHLIETFDYSGDLSSMSEEKREELNNFFKGKLINKGDIFFSLGLFKNKICFPMAGLCLGFDEFKNLKIERKESVEKEISCPVNSKIVKIEENKMVLEFRAREYKGQGMNGLKAWGEGEVKIVDQIKFLDFSLEDNILFTNNLDKAFLLKAEVIGVKGIVVLTDEKTKEMETNLPVLKLEEEKWDNFMKENLGKTRRILVNAKMNKLLLVLE